MANIVNAQSWDQRVAQIRLVTQNHGTGDHARVFAEVARSSYVPHLAPDFAYINTAAFYERQYFGDVYRVAVAATSGFTNVTKAQLAQAMTDDPRTLLIFRTILGLTKEEFAHSTALVAEVSGLRRLSASKVDITEKKGTAVTVE